ncbi:MAG: hypothetical protein V1678_00635 [Candidatus Aenigmatarchaeota archaeon]
MPTTVLAVYNTTDIDVNISSLSQITLYPNYLFWPQVTVGSMGGYKNITIKNTGSVNVSNIFAWVNTLANESVRPYGNSTASNYSAGGVLTITNETSTKYYYLGRIEWNWTDDIPNHDWTAVTSPVSWGYFRNMSDDYVWVMGNGTAGRCNETGSQFSIETDIDVGTLATRTPGITVSLTASSNDPTRWSYAAITSGTLAGHCVAAYYDCSKVYIYGYDKRTNFTGCANANYMLSGNLVPGETMNIKVDTWIPRGIPSGNLTRTTLTVEAT